jgi:hypothetical protein
MLVKLTLGWRPLTIWVLITNITEDFMLELYILHVHNASMDLGCSALQMGNEECDHVHPLCEGQ